MKTTTSFTCKWGTNVAGHASGKHGSIEKDGENVCNLNTWAFASCACFSIQGFSSWCPLLPEDITPFFNFLNSTACEDTWLPNEIYFLLTQDQVIYPWAKAMIAHPCVSLRDQFTNKSHGGRVCYLYRYSTSKDFK